MAFNSLCRINDPRVLPLLLPLLTQMNDGMNEGRYYAILNVLRRYNDDPRVIEASRTIFAKGSLSICSQLLNQMTAPNARLYTTTALTLSGDADPNRRVVGATLLAKSG